MDNEIVTITRKEYETLKKDSEWLNYLEQAGVDNWDGYGFAYELREKDEEAKESNV